MKLEQEELININKLLKVSENILDIYIDLINAEFERNQKQYQEKINMLIMYRELENNLYQRFGKNIEQLARVLNRIEYQNNRQSKNKNKKEVMISRIENSLIAQYFINPFLSMQNDISLKVEENRIAVAYQYDKDYISLIIHLLNQKIKDNIPEEIRAELILLKNRTIYENRLFEKRLLLSDSKLEPIIEGRAISSLFRQDENLIKQIYMDEIKYNLNDSIMNISGMSNYLLETSLSSQIIEQTNLINLEASLRLLEENEFILIYEDYYNSIKDSIEDNGFNKGLQDVLEVFQQVSSTSTKYRKVKKI